jgi:thiamine-phosphate pyrophosphorylase
MLVTQSAIMRPTFATALEDALRGGARWIQLREKNLARRELLQAAHEAQQLCARYGALLSINASPEVVCEVQAAGIHLPEAMQNPAALRAGFPVPRLVGQSVHSVEAARRATESGCDYVVFGSVFPTTSHPGMAAQGLEQLREVVAATPLSVLAIGGIGLQDVATCIRAGASGVAVVSAAWHSASVETAVRELVRATQSAVAEGAGRREMDCFE